MKLRKAVLEAVGPFSRAELTDLTGLTVIVGSNGSGKSFLLEALERFFAEFQIAGGTASWSSSDYYWHRRNSGIPLVVEVDVQLSTEEEDRLTSAGQGLADELGQQSLSWAELLHIRRELNYKQAWKTKFIRLGEIDLVVDDQPVSDLIVSKPRRPEKAVGDWNMERYPTNTIGRGEPDRLLVNSEAKVAFHSNDEMDELANSGMLSTTDFTAETTIADSLTAREITLTPGTPPEDQFPELTRAIRALKKYPANVVSATLQDLVKGAFKLIAATRGEPRPAGTRVSPLPPGLVSQVNQLGQDRTPAAESRYRDINRTYQGFTSKRLSPHAAGLEIDDERQFSPLAYQGGGEQAVLDLLWNLSEGLPIVALEEPESHLHPNLAREVFNHLRKASDVFQVIVTTHSPMMVDKAQPTNNWIARYDNRLSTLEHVQDRAGLRLVLAELGVLPSDIFLNDIVLFVEGDTERRSVLPIWARKFGIDLENNVGIISVDGESNLERYLRVLLRITEHAPTNYLVVLDAGAGALRERVKRELNITDNSIRNWSKNAIEDFYPGSVLAEVVQEFFGVTIDPKLLRGDGNDKVVGTALAEADRAVSGWKVVVGEAVAKKMTKEQVPQEVIEVLCDLAELAGQTPSEPKRSPRRR